MLHTLTAILGFLDWFMPVRQSALCQQQIRWGYSDPVAFSACCCIHASDGRLAGFCLSVPPRPDGDIAGSVFLLQPSHKPVPLRSHRLWHQEFRLQMCQPQRRFWAISRPISPCTGDHTQLFICRSFIFHIPWCNSTAKISIAQKIYTSNSKHRQ